ncbi:MAG: hypothetical protein ACMXYD_01020 [Candidatus Woesearchaeota archaeon]
MSRQDTTTEKSLYDKLMSSRTGRFIKTTALSTSVIISGLVGCSDKVGPGDPAAVSAQASSPAQVYTGQPASFSASCNAPDGLSGVTLIYEGPDETFTRTETPTGTRFSESFTKTYENEGVATLEILALRE